jgi:hypothetical protein
MDNLFFAYCSSDPRIINSNLILNHFFSCTFFLMFRLTFDAVTFIYLLTHVRKLPELVSLFSNNALSIKRSQYFVTLTRGVSVIYVQCNHLTQHPLSLPLPMVTKPIFHFVWHLWVKAVLLQSTTEYVHHHLGPYINVRLGLVLNKTWQHLSRTRTEPLNIASLQQKPYILKKSIYTKDGGWVSFMIHLHTESIPRDEMWNSSHK